MKRINFNKLATLRNKSHFSKIKNKNGITLIALVITIIILLILAGISIAILTGSGLFEKTKKAKEEAEKAQANENQTLSDYENRIDSIILGDSRDNNILKSSVFSAISCTAEQTGNKIKVGINPSFINGKGPEDVFEYILIVNNKAYLCTKQTECYIESIKPSTTYNIAIIGIDIETGMIKSDNFEITTGQLTYVEKLLEYPIITPTGVCNVIYECEQGSEYNYYTFDATKGKTTASNALPFECYDRDENTFAQVNVSGWRLQISDEFKEKNGILKLKASLSSGTNTGVYYQLGSSQNNLGGTYYKYWTGLISKDNYYLGSLLEKNCSYVNFSVISSGNPSYNLNEVYPYIQE